MSSDWFVVITFAFAIFHDILYKLFICWCWLHRIAVLDCSHLNFEKEKTDDVVIDHFFVTTHVHERESLFKFHVEVNEQTLV